MNQIFILDRNENVVAILSGNADDSGCHFFNSNLILEINKGASLTFDVNVNESEVVNHIKEENMVIAFDGENYRLLIIKEVADLHEDSCMKEVYCEDASCELIDEIIYDEVSGSVEMGTVLASILKGTRWQIGEVDNTYIRNLKPEFKLKSVLNGIYELGKQYDAEVDFTVEFAGNKIVARKVHMKKAFGRSLGKRFEFGKDTTSIKRTVNTADIKTAIVPFGKTDEQTGEALSIKGISWSKPAKALNKPLGQMFLEDEEATELWGYKGTGAKRRARWVAVTFEECEDENELMNYAYMQLNRFNKPKVSYEVEVVDLYRMMGDESYAHEKVGLGDLATILDFEFIPALALNSRVVKLELDLNDPSNSKATLGTIVESIVDKDLKTQIEELNVKVGAISNIDLSDIENRVNEVLGKTGIGTWEQVEEINNLIFNNSVGYHFMGEDKGIWVFDKPVNEKPTKAVAIKGGVIGLAKWDTQLQKWNVGTFIDGTSVNASMINTGTLKADRIEANALTVNHLNQELKTIVNSVGNKASREEVTTAIKTAVDEINLSVSSNYSTKEETSSTVSTAKTEAINTSKGYADTKKAEAIAQASSDATSKVNSAKTELNTAIDKKANTLDVYKKTETYTKTETDSAIKVAKDSIELGVKNTYETKTNVESKISNVTTDLTNKIDNIEIGGRNLWIKSKTTGYSAIESLGSNHITGQTECYRLNNGTALSFNIEPEFSSRLYRKVTFSAWVKYDNVVQGANSWNKFNIFKHILVRKNSSSGVTSSQDYPTLAGFTGTSDWKFVSYTYDYSSNTNYDMLKTSLMFNLESTISGTAWVTGIKVEIGDKVTDWTDAPEDVMASINAKASKTDVYTKTEVYTKTQTDSQIKASKDAINLSVSETYETKTNVATKVSTAKSEAISSSNTYADTKKTEAINSANATTTQMNSAITLTKEAITNEVSASYLTKGDAEGTYATQSSLKQTAKDITASFKSTGGYNLIKNSTGYNDINIWKKSAGTMGTATNNKIGGATTSYIYLDNDTNTSEIYAYSNRFNLKPNTKYTLSGWFHNYTKCPSFDVFVLSSTAVAEDDAGYSYTNVHSILNSQNTDGSWVKFSTSFITPANVLSGYVRIDNNGYNASGTNTNRVHWSALILNEGEETPWSPHPSEIYEGSTIIDASGVTIKNGALKVQNNSGQTVLSGDSTGNLTIGGNSSSGTLLVKDASGKTIGEMNQNGLSLLDTAMKISSKYRIGEGLEQLVTFDGAKINFSNKGGGANTSASIGIDTGSSLGFSAPSGHYFYGGDVLTYGGLSVNGKTSIKALVSNGNQILNGTDTWLRTYGETGWYNSTYQGGWYMTDYTWVRSYNGKNVYTNGIIQADNGFQVGGNIMARIEASGDIKGQDFYSKGYNFNSGSPSTIKGRSGDGGFDFWNKNGGTRFTFDGSNMKIYKVVGGAWTVLAG